MQQPLRLRNSSRMSIQPLLLIFLTVAITDGRQMARPARVPRCGSDQVLFMGQCLAHSSEGCTADFVAVGDQCLYFITFAALIQQEARQMCHSLDAELAVVDTATKLYNIIHYINDNGVGGNNYWVDGSDQVTEGDWRFSSSQPVPMGTPFWEATLDKQQPDDYDNDQDCMSLNAYYFYYVDDENCLKSNRPLCEQPRQSNTSVSLSVPVVDCPSFFVSVAGLCLSFMTWADQTWTEARQSCHGLGGELATVTDIEHLRAIYLYLHQEGIAGHSYWLGGSDAAAEGVWTWTDGNSVPMGAPFWGHVGSGTLEPDGGSSENCLLLKAEGFHYFRDDTCDLTANPLCQYDVQ